jgi:hypothetical protein
MNQIRNIGWAALAAVLIGAPAVADGVKPSNKWRIEISEGANTDGTIRFALTPVGGEMTQVQVNVKEGRSENDVAKDVRDAFKAALSSEKYDIEIDDGEDVLVKNKGQAPKFTVAFVASDVKGTRVEVERE